MNERLSIIERKLSAYLLSISVIELKRNQSMSADPFFSREGSSLAGKCTSGNIVLELER